MQAEIIVTNILQTKTAFGITKECNQSVFIPGKVAEAAKIRVGQTVNAMLIDNPNMPEKTPLMAVFILRGSEDDTLAEQIKADLEQGPATAAQIARSIGQPVDLVARKMKEMTLVQDTIYALTLADLVEED